MQNEIKKVVRNQEKKKYKPLGCQIKSQALFVFWEHKLDDHTKYCKAY